jgi:2-(1,2-epoxy-1,2-dihydrophenyl)acetyl-CoA isomerase
MSTAVRLCSSLNLVLAWVKLQLSYAVIDELFSDHRLGSWSVKRNHTIPALSQITRGSLKMIEPRNLNTDLKDCKMSINYEQKNAVAIITLDRPEKLNALTVEMREALGTYFETAARDPQVRSVLLQASGKAFCASGDVSKMGNFTAESGHTLLKLAHRMLRNLANIEKPVVAGVRGAVAGIGWSMAMASDAVIASNKAHFTQVFRHVGLVPDGGAIYFLTQHLGLQRAKELVYSGRRIDADEAHSLGLVNKVVADDQLDAAAFEYARDLAAGPTFALGVAKKMFKQMYQPDLEAFLESEGWAQGLALLTEDHAEGVRAFLEKRKPVFLGR